MTKLLVLRVHLDATQTLRNEGDVYEETNASYVKIREALGIVTTDAPKAKPAAPAPKPEAPKAVAVETPAATPFD